MHDKPVHPPGLLGEFLTPEDAVRAIDDVRALGITAIDAFTPYPAPAMETAVGVRRSKVPRWMLGWALTGGGLMYLLQWWINVVDYPLDIGGRPLHSAPMFIPLTFEVAVLSGAIGAVIGLLWSCRLPAPWHPVFEVPAFRDATTGRFFVAVDGGDPRFDPDRVAERLMDAGAAAIRPLGAFARDDGALA
jgi:hypothetical protein